VRFAHVNH